MKNNFLSFRYLRSPEYFSQEVRRRINAVSIDEVPEKPFNYLAVNLAKINDDRYQHQQEIWRAKL